MSFPDPVTSVNPLGISLPAVLTSSGPASLNRTASDQAVSPTSKKRKRDVAAKSLTTDHLLVAPVVLKPYPVKLTAKPHLLHPLMLLPRDNLPLSALDLSQPHGELSSSRLFDSKIKILDLEGRLGSNVLLARSETSHAVYAIEREEGGLYVICKLGPWVDIEALSRKATVVCSERIRTSKPPRIDTGVRPLITPAMHKDNKKRRLCIEEIQSMVRRRPTTSAGSQSRPSTPVIPATPASETFHSQSDRMTVPAIEPDVGPESAPTVTAPENETQVPAAADEVVALPTAEDIFQNIRTQYLEALYHSMGSLAYFAKGPLSRARAAFHLDCDANLEMNDLIDFLRSLVMTTIIIDKKYRETLPSIIEKANTLADDSDAGAAKPKKRKPKKPKLGKDGLYPSEAEHIMRWWAANKPAAVGDDEKTITSSETRYHVSCLRRRETQLQMIIILEILALEPLRRPLETGDDSQLPGMDSQLTSREDSQEPTVKKRTRTNLPVLLDVHADRLCIWQTTMSDETKALAESQVLPDGEHTQKSEKGNADPLRDFCVDIVVPFFSARLPELCNSINRKLGGPVAHSTPKERNAKPATTSKPKPGAPAKRPAAIKKDKEKTLERVLSNERMRRSISRGPSGALALMRSASATAIPGLKREGSEPLMSMIPRGELGSLGEKAANPLLRRTTSTAGEDSKAKKKALLDAELKDAISALKKPNRTLAVKEFVDAADKRASTSANQFKKLKKPARISAVQVKATPANSRFRDVLATSAGSLPSGHGLLDYIPSSSSVIPSSTMPRKFANMLGNLSSTPVAQKDHIEATPAKSKAPTIMEPLSSPIMTRKAAPSINSHHLAVAPTLDLSSSPGLACLFETPIQSRSRNTDINDTPIRSRLPAATKVAVPAPAKDTAETDIYAQLGWD
ncbi:DNA replication regulator SLD3-domain-containing protein [Cercophora newfieldiana]|uniref:DNA replication regulator SLD3-domain-containing protein n=1 Tax=Cercophora newfieldiana TaxID=92897 RepID=A0AA39YPK4_9PEZI|nr:DNA replication regulator SLD3-domain-containing protein [Cercophora newfieldiana]